MWALRPVPTKSRYRQRVSPSPDYGWGYIEVKGADPQQVTVAFGKGRQRYLHHRYRAADNVGSGPGSARTKDGLLTASGSGGTGTRGGEGSTALTRKGRPRSTITAAPMTFSMCRWGRPARSKRW